MKRPLLTKQPVFSGHVTIWDGISGRGRECTGRMKVAFCCIHWWPRLRMETEQHSISTGTYCGHNCVWLRWCYFLGCFSLNSKIDLYVLDGALTGQTYRDPILRPLVLPRFDGHPLASRSILMDDNAKPHRARIM